MENKQTEVIRTLCAMCLWQGVCIDDTPSNCEDFTNYDSDDGDAAFYEDVIRENTDEYQLFLDEMCA